jgi:ABC-type branched-subunit amino acid transport system permease subunit
MIGALGVDIRTLYTIVFALGAALAGLAGALVGALQSVQVGMGEPVLILAFVVIVIGGIGSIKGALVGALLVGLVDTMGRFLLPQLFGFFMNASQAGLVGGALASMLIYIVMAAILAVRPQGLFGVRGEAMTTLTRNRDQPRRSALAAAGRAFGRAPVRQAVLRDARDAHGGAGARRHRPQPRARPWRARVVRTCGLLRHVGGYAAGILASHAFSGAVQFRPVHPARHAISCRSSGSWPCLSAGFWLPRSARSRLRTSGVYFIMITLAFAQMTYLFRHLLARLWRRGRPVDPGEQHVSGLQHDGAAQLLPRSATGCCSRRSCVCTLFKGSRFGAALQASRQNEVRVASVGIAPFRIKLVAFVVSGMITALAGALYADLNRFVSPSMLSWHMSGEFIVLIILGGVGRLCGPVAGAMLFVMFEYHPRRPDRALAVLPRAPAARRRVCSRAAALIGLARREGASWLSPSSPSATSPSPSAR